MSVPNAGPDATLAAALLRWFDAEKRDLPWRSSRDPYAIWVSEVMLQQTQVETVKPYWLRFMERFPTIADLAGAELDEVLAEWQGLGYYRRARGLHQAAQAVMAQHGGQLPDDVAALRALPGVGDYTAGAVASMAFGLRAPAVDGNVNRVVTRLFAIPGDPRQGDSRRSVHAHAAALVPAERPGDFNQALMELGSRICTPRPACPSCPVRAHCAAYAAGQPTAYPERRPAPPPRDRLHACAVIVGEEGLLLAQRPLDGRWGGLWELPRVELLPDADVPTALRDGLAAALGVAVRPGERLAAVRHGVSGERIQLEAWRCELDGVPQPVGYTAVRWVPDPTALTLSSAQRRLLAALDHPRLAP
jgi:A/G-specific adenine glycosylase